MARRSECRPTQGRITPSGVAMHPDTEADTGEFHRWLARREIGNLQGAPHARQSFPRRGQVLARVRALGEEDAVVHRRLQREVLRKLVRTDRLEHGADDQVRVAARERIGGVVAERAAAAGARGVLRHLLQKPRRRASPHPSEQHS